MSSQLVSMRFLFNGMLGRLYLMCKNRLILTRSEGLFIFFSLFLGMYSLTAGWEYALTASLFVFLSYAIF